MAEIERTVEVATALPITLVSEGDYQCIHSKSFKFDVPMINYISHVDTRSYVQNFIGYVSLKSMTACLLINIDQTLTDDEDIYAYHVYGN